MNYHFTLRLTAVRCIHEAIGEWGADEMRVLGFGIPRKGPPFSISFRSLGSYHDGDVASSSVVPQTWFEADLPGDGLDVLLYFWLVEEDSGGVADAAASLEADFFEKFRLRAEELNNLHFPRECIPFTAFYKTILPLAKDLEEASTDGINNDELYFPWDLLLRYEGETVVGFSKEMTLNASKNAGHYELKLAYRYESQPVVHP